MPEELEVARITGRVITDPERASVEAIEPFLNLRLSAEQFVFVDQLEAASDEIAAANWDDALMLARTNDFDLYVIDNWMSGGSGIDLCKKLREFDTWTPILFYSGAAFERDKQQAFAAGAQGYLVKPAGPDELIAEVNRIISAARSQSGRVASAMA